MAKKPTYEELEQRVRELEREISQCKETEEELKQEQDVFIGGPVVVFRWLAIEDWPAAYVSPNVAQFGYRADDFVSREIRYIDIIHPEDLKRVLSAVEKYSESGVPFYEQQYRIVQADGQTKWVHDFTIVGRNDRSEITHYDGYILDITKRKQTEEALRESEERYRFLLDNISLGVALMDSDHNILMTNPVYGKEFNKPIRELVGKKCFREFEKREAICPHCPGVQAMGSGQPAEAETEGVRDDGSRFGVKLRAFPTFGKGGRVTGFIEIAEDITEKRKLRAELQHAQKLEAIGTLAGGIAHAFNNLLMAIQGNASLMLVDIDSTHPHSEYVANIKNLVKSGAELTRQLLGYARKGQYCVEPINFNLLVEQTSETLGRTRKDILIDRDLAEDLYAIEADQGQIQQVLMNLLVNAGDAMPGGGGLLLKTANVTDKDIKGKVYNPKPGNYVQLMVADTGQGMDQETLERIFDPFFTTKEMGRGTGLGLASVYGIIKGHGGYIDVESRKRQGTAFAVYLPATERKVETTRISAERIAKGTETILLVDDEESVLGVGVQMLKRLGYTVLGAKDGREALKIYEENKGQIGLVILDMVMPRMGGGEAYDKMKEINSNVRVLLSSGYSIDSQAKEILARGCDGFIQKPFGVREVSEKIREILDKK